MIPFMIMLMTAPVLLDASGPKAGRETNSFRVGEYMDRSNLERSEKIDADLRKFFAPGTQLSTVVRSLREQGATCEHAKAGAVAEFKFGGPSKPENTQEYQCEHEKSVGVFKKRTTDITIISDKQTCAVVDYRVQAGTAFEIGSGNSVHLGMDPAAHCFTEKKE